MINYKIKRQKFSVKPIAISIFILLYGLNIGSEAQSIHSSSAIRLNTHAYLVHDQKIAIIGAFQNLDGQDFFIVDAEDTSKILWQSSISADRGNKDTPFNFNFPCDFSQFKKEGKYRLKLKDYTISPVFVIGGSEAYQNALNGILRFYRSQRCGDTNPLLHKPCHLNDKHNVIDVSGGWHDAGDYIKYMTTVTFTAVELLTAADYAVSYNFEKVMDDLSPANGIPDLLEEARIGLEWILKMTSDYYNGNYYHQVSGEEDHEGWRLPEVDDHERDLGKSRSLYKGWGGNLLGRSAAALSIAYRLFKKYDIPFAEKCLLRAEALFADRDSYKKVQNSIPDYFYHEAEWLDDMVLGAAELYQTTLKNEYREYAVKNVRRLTGDNISWKSCDYLSFAACLKANIETGFCLKNMKDILDKKQLKMNQDVYYLSSGYCWGTTAEFTADAQKAIMYFYLTSDSFYLNLATAQRDFLLGRNNWGTSFVVGLGEKYPLHTHSQINSLADLQTGGVVGGPAEMESWKKVFPDLKIQNDRFAGFQSNILYHDNQDDYYTNEMALDYAAPSVFLFMHYIAMSLD